MKWKERKWTRWVWRHGGMKFVARENDKTLRKIYPDPVSSTTKPRGVSEMRNRDPSGGRRASNLLRHGAALLCQSESYFILLLDFNFDHFWIFEEVSDSVDLEDSGEFFYPSWYLFWLNAIWRIFEVFFSSVVTSMPSSESSNMFMLQSYFLIYINKNVNVRLYLACNLRKFSTDRFEILTQRCIRIRECFYIHIIYISHLKYWNIEIFN